MNSSELLELIKKDVSDVKQNGSETIPVDNLLHYLSEIDVTEQPEANALTLEGIKHQNSTQLEMLKIENNFQIESFKAAISIGANACRTFLIMNGGAAIALLAFLGNIWNKNSSTEAASAIATALFLFCGGVVLAGLCSGLSYFSQCFFSSSYGGRKKVHLWLGQIINALACICGGGSIFIFAYGSFSAYQSMIAQLVK
ncbi:MULTISPECIES: hypothetical protein [Klebsiella]|nr:MULTISPECIES: hypothetical protein [Klebsiella]ELP0887366.1 hypothetical protein [Klebsiella oxytoca]MBZ6677865.1 hypothetical protein [Klebsiella pneumoniae]MDX4480220.1 hypothetical protein [Klebsiella pneumoniae]MDX4486548.1 hypothetical protein [Klebsiella pneumoniae]MDX4496582.1 hypothetical protein [Klebsiella pneumoniae]